MRSETIANLVHISAFKVAILDRAANLWVKQQRVRGVSGLKKWAFLCAVSVAIGIVGCGGGGGGNSSSVTGGTTGRAAAATINIPNKQSGTVYLSFLTGRARTVGDLYMNIENAGLIDDVNRVEVDRQDISPLSLHLAAYTLQYGIIDVTQNTLGANSESFDQFIFAPYTFATEQANGVVGLNPGDTDVFLPDSGSFPLNVPTRCTVFPGRTTSLPIFVDDSMFTVNTSTVSLIPSQFNAINLGPNPVNTSLNGKIPSFLADYVQFDLSHVPAANVPSLSAAAGGKKATHFYVSGDNYAMSDDGAGSQTGNFEELSLDVSLPVDGAMAQPHTPQSDQFNFGNFPGTYDVRQADPSDISGVSKITSLYGEWRSLTNLVLLQNTTFDIIVFPNSDESYTQAEPADVVAIAHNGTTITNMYIGYAYFTASSGKPTARLFPIPTFVNAGVSGEVDYTLSNYTNSLGVSTTNEPSVRNGTFTYASGAKPTGFANSGTFVVFR